MSTVSPSIRPLTKSLPSVALALVRQHPHRPSKVITSSIQVCFIKFSPCLPAIGLLCNAVRTPQVRASQAKGVESTYARVSGFRKPILCIHDFSVVRNTLSEPDTGQFH